VTETSERTLDTVNPIADICVRFLYFAANQERATIERGDRYRREVAERLFAQEFWPTMRVILWIGFRDRRQVDEYVSSVRRARWYGSLQVPNPEQELLTALQRGRIYAIAHGARLSREAWASTKSWGLPVVMFDSREVLKTWPESAQRRAPGSSKAKGDCWRWLTEMMNEWPNRRPKPKGKLLAEAVTKIPGLTERGFNEAWKEAINGTGARWNKPGRPVTKTSQLKSTHQ
jgi:hypothetical protein